MSHPIVRGSTDQSVILRIIDSADGTPETGVAWNTSGIDLWYRREGGARVAITEASLAAVDSAHTDGGFIHIGDGYCRLDLPDAAVASGANYVTVGGTVTGMVVLGAQHPLVAQVALNASGHVTLADASVTAAKFGAGAITATVLADDAITAGKIAANAITSSEIADGAITAAKVATTVPASLDTTQTAAVADRVLNRNIAGGSDGGRTVRQAFGVIRNRVAIDTVSNLLVVYDTDDTTVLWTAAITTATRNPLTSVDPT